MLKASSIGRIISMIEKRRKLKDLRQEGENGIDYVVVIHINPEDIGNGMWFYTESRRNNISHKVFHGVHDALKTHKTTQELISKINTYLAKCCGSVDSAMVAGFMVQPYESCLKFNKRYMSSENDVRKLALFVLIITK